MTDYEIFEDETGDKNVNGASRTTITVDGDSLTAYGPFNFTEGMGGEGQNKDKIELEQEITFSNVQQKVPLVVKKENSYTGAFVSGAKYVVYEYDEGADNHQGDPVITETEITGSGGSFLCSGSRKEISGSGNCDSGTLHRCHHRESKDRRPDGY